MTKMALALKMIVLVAMKMKTSIVVTMMTSGTIAKKIMMSMMPMTLLL